MYVEGLLLTGVLVTNLIEAIDYLVNKTASPSAGYFPQEDNGRYDGESNTIDWDSVFKKARKEIKQEKKRDKVHPKVEWNKFALAYENITGETI